MFTIKTANIEKLSPTTDGQGLNWAQIFLGIVVLLLGSLVYLIDRAPEHTYFIYQSSINLSLYNSASGLFGTIGNNLPSFVHAFAFVLITAGLFATRQQSYLIICLFWFLIDALFEFGQRFVTSAASINRWFTGIPFLENTESYFIHGTFDWNDVAATAIGVIAAYLILRATTKKSGEVHHEYANIS